jgi:glutathione S-transferase
VPGGLKGPAYRAINPNGLVPTLQDGDQTIWESAAIMLHLALKANSPIWPVDPRQQVEVMRWISWDLCHFARHTGAFYFENYIKPTFGFGTPDRALLEAELEPLHQSAAVLDARLAHSAYLAGPALTIADFCVGVLLPLQEEIGLPLGKYQHLQRWHGELMQLDAWRNPWPRDRSTPRGTATSDRDPHPQGA